MVNLFLEFCREKNLATDTQESAGEAMVQSLHRRFFSGYTASDGVYAVVGWMALHPSYSKHRPLFWVRSHRALKGWQRLAPARSKSGMTIFVVSGVAVNSSVADSRTWRCGS